VPALPHETVRQDKQSIGDPEGAIWRPAASWATRAKARLTRVLWTLVHAKSFFARNQSIFNLRFSICNIPISRDELANPRNVLQIENCKSQIEN
jgi:hypothetical protein